MDTSDEQTATMYNCCNIATIATILVNTIGARDGKTLVTNSKYSIEFSQIFCRTYISIL